MILHLHTDSRFADYTINIFGNGNHHLVGMRYPGQKFRFLSPQNNVSKYIFGWSDPEDIIRKFKPKMIVVHYMDSRWYEVLSKVDGSIKVTWIFWGGDGYNLPELKKELYDPLTLQCLNLNRVRVSKFGKLKADLNVGTIFSWAFVASLLFEILRKRRIKLNEQDQKLALFERVDYCGTFLKEDYELLKSKYSFKMEWTDARFISLEKLVGSLEPIDVLGNHVLLGNSCTLENNHIDALETIKHLEFEENQEVICPLSYGKDIGEYRDYVIKKGRENLDQRFHPMIDLMSLDEYTKVLSSCGFAIMYHNRQQAFNSVLALIVLGVKVYFKPQNTIYLYLRRIGCHVFSISDLKGAGNLKHLEKSKIEENRKILFNEFSQTNILECADSIRDLAYK